MNKIKFSLISIITCSSIYNSINANQLSSPSNTFFSRLGLGLACEYVNIEGDLKILAPQSLGRIGSTQAQTAKRVQPAISIEYGIFLEHDFYLGVLASWRPMEARNASRTPGPDTIYFLQEFHINQYLDILAKPGVKLAPHSMLYGLIGPSFASWSHTTTVNLATRNGSSSLLNAMKLDKKSIGLGLGFGIEHIFRKKYAISLDYCFHLHRATTKTKYITYTTGGVNYSGDLNKIVKPSYSTIALRFTYFFNL